MRFIVCSAWGVSEMTHDIPGWFKWLIQNSNIGVAYEDHNRQERIVSVSAFNWTILRPVGLTNSSKEQSVLESFDNHPKPSLTISRKSVAGFLLDSLEQMI